jgi:hypothetical protein
MGNRNVIGLPCRLNCTEEVLFPNSLKTHLGIVGGSAFTHIWEHKHTGTRGPACSLPIWIQFARPTAIGRIEFSARLVLSSNSG